jgi:hypothetical protein
MISGAGSVSRRIATTFTVLRRDSKVAAKVANPLLSFSCGSHRPIRGLFGDCIIRTMSDGVPQKALDIRDRGCSRVLGLSQYFQLFCHVALVANVHSAENILIQIVADKRLPFFANAIPSCRCNKFEWIFVSETLAKMLGQQQFEVNE